MTDDKKLHFHFDFLSPFGYLASLRLDDLTLKNQWECEWHPMLLGVTVLKIMGLPPIAELPLKGPYIRKDAERYMRRHNIVLGRALGSPQINPLLPARVVCWLKHGDPSLAHRLAKDLYHAHWMLDKDISQIEVLTSILDKHEINKKEVLKALDNGDASKALRDEVDESVAYGVFGSPTFRVGKELFFGLEKLEVVDDWLRLGGW